VIADVRADLADAAVLSVVEDKDNILRMPSSFRSDKAVGWNRTVRRRSPVRRRPTATRSTTRKSTSKASTAKKAPAKKPASKAVASKTGR
jgi:hypothetical protein